MTAEEDIAIGAKDAEEKEKIEVSSMACTTSMDEIINKIGKGVWTYLYFTIACACKNYFHQNMNLLLKFLQEEHTITKTNRIFSIIFSPMT